MPPKKSLGQHWLFDDASLNAMLEAGEVTGQDFVVEVGPGLGPLTAKLCAVAKHVEAVELDDILVANLHANTVKRNSKLGNGTNHVKNLSVVHKSILDYDTIDLPKGYKVIANIPYYLTSNLIRIMLESSNPPSVMVLLIQKEVAERVAAEPGQMGILSVADQFYAEVSLKQHVPAKLFTPPPKVDSQIIQLKQRSEPLFPDADVTKFFTVVRAGFSEKRKKLRSALSGGLQISKIEADSLIIKAGISADARAQELTLSQWNDLYKAFL